MNGLISIGDLPFVVLHAFVLDSTSSCSIGETCWNELSSFNTFIYLSNKVSAVIGILLLNWFLARKIGSCFFNFSRANLVYCHQFIFVSVVPKT